MGSSLASFYLGQPLIASEGAAGEPITRRQVVLAANAPLAQGLGEEGNRLLNAMMANLPRQVGLVVWLVCCNSEIR